MNMRLILLLALLLSLPALVPLAATAEGDQGVLHPLLREKLATAASDEQLEIIVQFRPAMTDDDLAVARALGVEVIRTYAAIDGFYGRGAPDDIRALSNYAPVFWMEFNAQLAYAMHDTTHVVEAVKTWHSVIVDTDGEPRDDGFGDYEHIDGSEVAVVVIDTGIDAGHPDFDYDQGKTIAYKFDGSRWYETENSDTSSGHGTHCGGTVAGNGDASAGSRSGTAPGATLIGLGVGDLLFINFGLDAFEWVYEHSRPDANPLNIRVVSNSWGSSGAEYNPNDAISQIVMALAYDNNVISVFAAGNAGGDGSDLRTNPYANIPLAISVAALEHDGTGIADFSSRGKSDLPQTWPDIGAPGVDIWATSPRATVIDAATKSQGDLYYMAISGTSMATPHIAGISALLYQAAPHLGVAEYLHEDHATAEGEWYGEDGARADTKITEAELVLELSGRYLPGAQAEANVSGYSSGAGTPHDWGQGHGLIDVHHAVSLALTLETLRTQPGTRMVTVFDAYRALHGYPVEAAPDVDSTAPTVESGVRGKELFTRATDTLGAVWKGDWAHLVDDEDETYTTNNEHFLFAPAGVVAAHIDLSYAPVNLERTYIANVDVTIDIDGDGQKDDLTPQGTTQDHKHYELTVTPETAGHIWAFGLNGQAYGGKPVEGLTVEEFWEPLVAYDVSVRFFFAPGDHTVMLADINVDDYGMECPQYARLAQLTFGEPSTGYLNTTLTLELPTVNLSQLAPLTEPVTEDDDDEGLLPSPGLLGGLAALGLAARRRR